MVLPTRIKVNLESRVYAGTRTGTFTAAKNTNVQVMDIIWY